MVLEKKPHTRWVVEGVAWCEKEIASSVQVVVVLFCFGLRVELVGRVFWGWGREKSNVKNTKTEARLSVSCLEELVRRVFDRVVGMG
jgi:hypothetical protein